MERSLTTTQPGDLQYIVRLVTDSVTSPHSRRAYGQALNEFLLWYDAQGRHGLNKAAVNAFRAELLAAGKSPASINLTLSAIRKLATEAADNGYLDPMAAEGIRRVKGVKAAGVKLGNWLTREQAQTLIQTPDPSTLKGLRDRAILAIMLGGGLRRSEIAKLKVDDIQQREGRWVILDLVGKGNRVRTVPIPAWVKLTIDYWLDAAGIRGDRLFRPVNKSGRLYGDELTPQAIYNVVAHYSELAGFVVAAHDLRRTFARLAHHGGAALDQIQLTLGHASIQTTERYLGIRQDLHHAPCDVLGLALK